MNKLICTGITVLALSGVAFPAFAADHDAPRHTVESPATIPADVVKFAADFSKTMNGRDPDRLIKFYSKRYLHDGANREVRRKYLQVLAPKMSNYDLRITAFEPIGRNRAMITAHSVSESTADRKGPDYQIVREKGQWRWLGNQRKTPKAIQ